jgi:hypothetical protein
MSEQKQADDIARRTTISNAIVVALVVIGVALVAWSVLVSMPPPT